MWISKHHGRLLPGGLFTVKCTVFFASALLVLAMTVSSQVQRSPKGAVSFEFKMTPNGEPAFQFIRDVLVEWDDALTLKRNRATT